MRSLHVLFLLATSVLALSACSPAFAQELEETLGEVGADYARAYTAPLADALGANLNSGFFHDVPLLRNRNGFGLYFGLQGFGAVLPENSARFDLTFETDVMLDARVGGSRTPVRVPATFTVRNAPTITGSETPAVATVTARYDTTVTRYGIAFPVSFDTTFSRELIGGLLETSIVPTAVPQLRIGRLAGTDLVVRWLPRIEVAELGALELFGLGFNYSLSQFLPDFPIGLAAQAFWQHVSVDDAEDVRLLDFDTFAAGINVSRRFGPLALYGGLQTERSTMEVAYTFDPNAGSGLDEIPEEVETVPVSFSLTGAVRGRATVGFGLHAGPLLLNADYSMGAVQVFTAGLGIDL